MSGQFNTPEVTSEDKLWAAVGYIFSPLAPLFLLLFNDTKDRPFIRYHCIQAILIGIILTILIPMLGGCGIIIWLLMFYLAYQAYMGKMIEIPYITDFLKKQGWI